MNSTRTLTLALAVTACTLAHAQWYPVPNSGGGNPTLSFHDMTSVNGVPIIVGTNGTTTGYSGPVGAFWMSGTDTTQRNYIKGLAAAGLTSSLAYSQVHGISWDGTKISTGANIQTLDGSMRAGFGVYDIPTDILTPLGSLGFYSSSGTPAMAANGYSISGDGSTVCGQAYWKAAHTGVASTANNVMPALATNAGVVGLLSSTNNNGRTQCVSYNGTAAGGFGVGSSDPLIWRKVAGVWQPGVTPAGTNSSITIASGSLTSPSACDATGRYFVGNYNGSNFNSFGDNPAYLLDTTTGKVTFTDVPTGDPGRGNNNIWRSVPSQVSSYGDIIYGRFDTYFNIFADLATGFVWTPTSGLRIMDDFVDAQWPGVRNPNLHINSFGSSMPMSPDGDWVVCSTFRTGTDTTVIASSVIVRLGTPLRGVGTLQDYVGDKKAKTLTWTLKDGGGNVVDTLTGKLDDIGRWVWLSKIDLGSSTWSLEIDGGQFLRKTIPVTQATKNSLNFSLQNGDPDHSGEVDAADIDLVIAHFGEIPTSGGWDADIDVDGSDEVDAVDIDIVIANFGGVDN